MDIKLNLEPVKA